MTTITETVEMYTGSMNTLELELNQFNLFPNPSSDLLVLQHLGLNKEKLEIKMFDMSGKLINETAIMAGSKVAYFDTKTLYAGQYIIQISNGGNTVAKKVLFLKSREKSRLFKVKLIWYQLISIIFAYCRF